MAPVNRQSCGLISRAVLAHKRGMSTPPEILRLAAACAARLREVAAADASSLEAEFRALLSAVQAMDPKFGFDRDGRPGALKAVRAALPTSERELLDAIVEDHACEIAAVHEAMFQVARAAAHPRENENGA